jgi:hypothetical protein
VQGGVGEVIEVIEAGDGAEDQVEEEGGAEAAQQRLKPEEGRLGECKSSFRRRWASRLSRDTTRWGSRRA